MKWNSTLPVLIWSANPFLTGLFGVSAHLATRRTSLRAMEVHHDDAIGGSLGRENRLREGEIAEDDDTKPWQQQQHYVSWVLSPDVRSKGNSLIGNRGSRAGPSMAGSRRSALGSRAPTAFRAEHLLNLAAYVLSEGILVADQPRNFVQRHPVGDFVVLHSCQDDDGGP